MWPPLLATRGPGASSTLHAHHAMHVVLALEGELSIKLRSGKAQRAPGVLTAPDVPHAIDAAGTEALLVFLDPESLAGAALLGSLTSELRLFSARERDQLLTGAEPLAIMSSDFGQVWTRRAASLLGGAELANRPRVHPRVRKALRLLQADALKDDVSLQALAQAVQLSPGRLMHAFTESVGIPLRPYLQWLKVQRAAAAIASGAALSDAAHAAGFADAAHMSRTFRRMFGASPSALRPAKDKARVQQDRS